MAAQTTSRETVYLQWDRHGFMTSVVEFPAGHDCELIERWRRRVTANGGWPVEPGSPAPLTTSGS